MESLPRSQNQEPYTSNSHDSHDVEVSTGELIISITDLEIPWPGFRFRFTRTYRSESLETTSMGAGWSHNYLERLASGDTCSTIIYHRKDDWTGAFTFHEEDPFRDKWTGPEGSDLVLRRVPAVSPPETSHNPCDDGEFVLRIRDGELHHFDYCGVLTKIEDRYGNYVSLRYGTGSLEGLLVAVESKEGYQVIFGYQKRQLHAITDCGLDDINRNGKCDGAATRTITYTIGPTAGCQNDLQSVIAPTSVQAGVKFGSDVLVSGKVTKYKYKCVPETADHDPRNHNLTDIIDGRESAGSGIPFTTIHYYDSNTDAPEYDRVHTVADRGMSGAVLYTYRTEPPSETQVTDRTGGVTEYVFDPSRLLKERRRSIDAQGHYIKDTYDYDVHNHLQTKILGWLSYGNYLAYEERYKFDAQGDIIERRIGGDGPDAIVTRFTYDPIYGQLRTTTDPRAFPDANNLTMSAQFPEEPEFSNVSVRAHTITRQIDYQESAYGALPREFTQYIEDWGLRGAWVASSLSTRANLLGRDLNGDGKTNGWRGLEIGNSGEIWTNPDRDSIGAATTPLRLLQSWTQFNERSVITRIETELGDGTSRWTNYTYGTSADKPYEWGQLISKTIGVAGDQPFVTTQYTCDRWGNVATETDPRGVVTRYYRNTLNLTYRTRHADQIKSLQYDEESTFDLNNKVTETRKQAIGSGKVSSVTYRYDAQDRKISESVYDDRDGKPKTTLYKYDNEGRLSDVFFPSGGSLVYKYDAAGRRIAERQYSHRKRYTNRPFLEDSDDTPDTIVRTEYDGLGNARVITEYYPGAQRSANMTEKSYDFAKRLTDVRSYQDFNSDGTFDPNEALTFNRSEFDQAGLVVARSSLIQSNPQSNPRVSRTVILNDELGRPFQTCEVGDVHGDSCRRTWYTQAPEIERVQEAGKGGSADPFVKNFTYDLAGRTKTMNDSLGNAVLSSYDANGNLTREEAKKVEDDGTVRVSVTVSEYDQLNRLTRKTVDILGYGTTPPSHRVFNYDSNGTPPDDEKPDGDLDE